MSVSLIVLRLEVDDTLDEVPSLHYEATKYFAYTKENELTSEIKDLSLTLKSEPVVVPEHFKEIPSLHRGKREFREILIQTYFPDISMEEEKLFKGDIEERKSTGEKTDESREHRLSESDPATLIKSPLTIQYFSGNPSVEVTKGILHLFKDKFISPYDSNVPRSDMLCMLGVPAKCTCQDLQKYIAPAKDTIRHIKIIRDSIPNQYMVLIKFIDQVSADMFYQEYEGKQYNLLESEISHIVYVAKVETLKSSQGGYLPLMSFTELPTCPVCLERMDESVAGILTVLCNHSFHNECLIKWQDTCCPVCRYCQTPEPAAEHTCFECDSKESLWICVICGHIGCGRYQEQHAYQHYQQTAHTFSMHLGNQRVWDYAGDNYVHRLIQSKGDGKVVALDNREEVDNEKMDSLTLEYTYLLTNQLESQRLYFEEKIGFLENDAYEKISLMEADVHKKSVECRALESRLLECEKERKTLEKKNESIVAKATDMAKEMRDEKQMNVCLRENQAVWQQKVDNLEKHYLALEEQKRIEVEELKCEISDLMKHLEVQCAVGNAEQGMKEDIQGGQIFVDQSSPSSSKGTRPRKNRKK